MGFVEDHKAVRGNDRVKLKLTEDLFVRHAKALERILQRAVREALRQHKRAGNPVAVSGWKNGKVVLIPPVDIPILEIRKKRDACLELHLPQKETLFATFVGEKVVVTLYFESTV